MIRRVRQQDWRVLLAMMAVVGVASGAVYFRRIAYPTQGDYSLHVLYAQQVVDGRFEDLPLNALAHPALQFIMAGLHYLTLRKLGLYASLMVVQTAAQVLTALVLYFWLGTLREGISSRTRALWAASLTLVAPVMLLAIWDGQFYYGYVGLANYHNPTIHLLRPFALLSLICGLRIYDGRRDSWRMVSLSAALVLISGAIKPNYALVILPSLLALAALRFLRKRSVDWRMLGLGFVLPGILVLSSQYLVAYWLARGEQAGIVFRPFEVVDAFSDHLALKLLLSILFPLAALWAAAPRIKRDAPLQLAWLAFAFGAAQMYLLAESGDRFFHGNFRWSAQIALFLLFAVSARSLMAMPGEQIASRVRRRLVAQAIYLVHLAAGIAYYVRSLIVEGYG